MVSILSRLSILTSVRDRTPYEFHFVAHQTSSKEERLLEPAFYVEGSVDHCVPEGDHIEVEVFSPWITLPLPENMHLHVNPFSGRMFVCYTPRLPTMQEAYTMLVLWSVGTAFTLVTGKDFVPEIAEGTDAFFNRMEKEYGIVHMNPVS